MNQPGPSLHRALLGLALSVLYGCPEEPPPELVKNSCITDLNCGGGEEYCDQSTLMCVRPHTVEPYRVVLQVQPENTSLELPDGGRVTLVAETAFELGTLDGGVKDAQLELPAAYRAHGLVQGMVDGGMQLLESQLTLTPRMGGVQLRATVVNSARSAMSDDAGTYNVEAELDRSLTYDLRVQPLLGPSTTLPPYRSAEPYKPGDALDVEFGEMEARSARLTSFDGRSWGNMRVRLEEKDSGVVMSSIAEVASGSEADAGTDGRFSLYAERGILTGPRKPDLVTDLSGRFGDRIIPRWQVTIGFDAARFLPDAVITMPSVPDLVEFEGTVSNVDTGQPLPNASLEFISQFPVDEDSAGNSNWCKHPDMPELSCNARLSTTTDEKGHFSRRVVPGSYDIFVQPDRAASPDRATFKLSARPEDTPGMRPQTIEVGAATRYDGFVRSPQNQGMPNVTFNGRALGLYEEEFANEDDRVLAQYNRSISTVTDSRGAFSIYPDIGRYDFSVETPAESGFAWMFCPNYVIRPRDRTNPIKLNTFKPPTPVILAGRVEHEGVALPNARIEAYAVWNTEAPRLLLVARAVSDAEGKYRLAMPTQLPPPMPDRERQQCPIIFEQPDEADLDAGLESMDSGLAVQEASVSAPDSGR